MARFGTGVAVSSSSQFLPCTGLVFLPRTCFRTASPQTEPNSDDWLRIGLELATSDGRHAGIAANLTRAFRVQVISGGPTTVATLHCCHLELGGAAMGGWGRAGDAREGRERGSPHRAVWRVRGRRAVTQRRASMGRSHAVNHSQTDRLSMSLALAARGHGGSGCSTARPCGSCGTVEKRRPDPSKIT